MKYLTGYFPFSSRDNIDSFFVLMPLVTSWSRGIATLKLLEITKHEDIIVAKDKLVCQARKMAIVF